MNPIQMLLMAARGHAGLPTEIQHAPAQQNGGGGGSDRDAAKEAAADLTQLIGQVTDPALQAVFSTCLSALHKYLAQDQKEAHQALSGKLSPRLMAQATGGGR